MPTDLTIAKTIIEQLNAFGKVKVFSWGARGWTGGDNFLLFRVSGRKFQGIVKITLNGLDLYDIQFIRGTSVKKEIKDVYFDQLTELIDEHVEKVAAYK
jgi:hypothetical protein